MQQEEFLSKVQDYGGLDSKDEALRMTKIFLGTLGEWNRWQLLIENQQTEK